jgi:hypothetical protein
MGLEPLKCFKCGGIGHVAIDKKCPAFDMKTYEKQDAFLKRIEDPMHEVCDRLIFFFPSHIADIRKTRSCEERGKIEISS